MSRIVELGYRPSVYEANLEEAFLSFISEDPDFETRYADLAAVIRAVSSLVLAVASSDPKVLASASVLVKSVIEVWMDVIDKEELFALCDLMLDTELHQLFWTVSQLDTPAPEVEVDLDEELDEELKALGVIDQAPPIIWSTVQHHQPELTDEENQRLSSLGLAEWFSSGTQRARMAARILLKLTDRQIEVIARQRTKIVREMREKAELDRELTLLLGSDPEDLEGSEE